MLVRAESWLRPVISYVPHQLKNYAILGCTPLYLLHEHVFAEQYADAGILRGLKGVMALAERRLEWQTKHILNKEDVHNWFVQLGYAAENISHSSHNCSGVEGVRV